MSMMTLPTLLQYPPNLRIFHIETQPASTTYAIRMFMRSTARMARCPLCHRASRKVHSQYHRTLTDLPCVGRTLTLVLTVRRFFCGSHRCARKIFCERVGELALAHAHRTGRMADSLQSIGMANGGRAGSRLAARLGLPASRMTLLRLVRAAPCPPAPTPTALGVDDFAFRRGYRYGTLLYDLETHKVVDMLPERSAESLAAWLRVRPQIEIISRDRGGIYAQGARDGAPRATQVADRWHLIDNLADALARVLSQLQPQLHQAALEAARPPSAEATVAVSPLPPSAETADLISPGPKPTAAQKASQIRRMARLERFETVRRLHAEGHTNQGIAAHLRMGASTVRRLLGAARFPERAVRCPMPSKLARFHLVAQQRWQAGCHDVSVLLEELRQQGYTGCRSRLYAFLKTLRDAERPEASLPPAGLKFSPRYVASVFVKQERTAEEQSLLDRLLPLSLPLETARRLAEGFTTLLRHRTNEAELALAKWVDEATAASLPALASFARGLREDWAAVVAGFSLNWSNGPVEGAVNRLKMIKRQMYGRANFDLLRRRVMLA
jgi:transposase